MAEHGDAKLTDTNDIGAASLSANGRRNDSRIAPLAGGRTVAFISP